MSIEAISIAGGGPSGLAAALTLARAGRQVMVYEKGAACGALRHDDLEGLETWIFPQDPMDYLEEHRLPTGFEVKPTHTFHFIDPRGQVHSTSAPRPFFYLLRRGSGPGSLDWAFQQAAEAAGVELRFNETRAAHQVHIFAGGPRKAKAYVQGLTFRATAGVDGVYLLLGDPVAPEGYAYCILWDGRGTIASAYRPQRTHTPDVLAGAARRFQDVLGLRLEETARFSAYGTYGVRPSTDANGTLLVGEAGGFQDALFGFGLNYALRSGVLAARSLLQGSSYGHLCRRELGRRLASSWINRGWYERLGEGPRAALAAALIRRNAAWEALHRVSQPSVAKRLLVGWSYLRGAR